MRRERGEFVCEGKNGGELGGGDLSDKKKHLEGYETRANPSTRKRKKKN